MLATRIATALVLLAGLLLLVKLQSFYLFAGVAALFTAAAIWENARLFQRRFWPDLLFSALLFGMVVLNQIWLAAYALAALATLIWIAALTPTLKLGLPDSRSWLDAMLGACYGLAITVCLIAIVMLFQRSALYLFSIMAIVWIADIGAYFSGKAFGKRKLAPSISPGKSWEGVAGGWLAVIVAVIISSRFAGLRESFAVKVLQAWSWPGLIIVMTVLVAASVVGDLFESQLKRRAGFKDSSQLLPGHGGVLDRIDALIPVLPLAVCIDVLLSVLNLVAVDKS